MSLIDECCVWFVIRNFLTNWEMANLFVCNKLSFHRYNIWRSCVTWPERKVQKLQNSEFVSRMSSNFFLGKLIPEKLIYLRICEYSSPIEALRLPKTLKSLHLHNCQMDNIIHEQNSFLNVTELILSNIKPQFKYFNGSGWQNALNYYPIQMDLSVFKNVEVLKMKNCDFVLFEWYLFPKLRFLRLLKTNVNLDIPKHVKVVETDNSTPLEIDFDVKFQKEKWIRLER